MAIITWSVRSIGVQAGMQNRTPRLAGIDSARKRLWSALNTSLRIYHPAREWMRYNCDSFNENPYQPRVAQKVVGLAFLNAVGAWEQFVERSFLGYMAGARAASGYSPELSIGACQNRPHAFRLLGAIACGNPQRLLRWNDWNWVRHVAEVFFCEGKPYSSLPQLAVARLQDAQVVRNRVAHDSAKSLGQFKRLVNALYENPVNAPLPRGFSPGEFLANDARKELFPTLGIFPSVEHSWGDYFESFVSMYFDASVIISPLNDR